MQKTSTITSLDLNNSTAGGRVEITEDLLQCIQASAECLQGEGTEIDQFRQLLQTVVAQNIDANPDRPDVITRLGYPFFDQMIERIEECVASLKSSTSLSVEANGGDLVIEVKKEEVEMWNFYSKVLQLFKRYHQILQETKQDLSSLRAEIGGLEPEAESEEDERKAEIERLTSLICTEFKKEALTDSVLKGLRRAHPRDENVKSLIKLKGQIGPKKKKLTKREKSLNHSGEVEGRLAAMLESLSVSDGQEAVKEEVLKIAEYLNHHNSLTTPELRSIRKALDSQDASRIIRVPYTLLQSVVEAQELPQEAEELPASGPLHRRIPRPLAFTAAAAAIAVLITVFAGEKSKPKSPRSSYSATAPVSRLVTPPAPDAYPGEDYSSLLNDVDRGDQEAIEKVSKRATQIVKEIFSVVSFADLQNRQEVVVSIPGIRLPLPGTVTMKPLRSEQMGAKSLHLSYVGFVITGKGTAVPIEFDLEVAITSDADRERQQRLDREFEKVFLREYLIKQRGLQPYYSPDAPAGSYVVSPSPSGGCGPVSEAATDPKGYLVLNVLLGVDDSVYAPNIGIYKAESGIPTMYLRGKEISVNVANMTEDGSFHTTIYFPISELWPGDGISQHHMGTLGNGNSLSFTDALDLHGLAQNVSELSAQPECSPGISEEMPMSTPAQ